MPTFTQAPQIRKGALVALDLLNPRPQVIVFQYNPVTLQRSLTARMSYEEGDRTEIQRLQGPPQEEITVTVELDATDQLEMTRERVFDADLGVYPQLSALELLIYPSSLRVAANAAASLLGTLEIVPPQAPLTLFVWGTKRILPVRLNSFSIEETTHDLNLNPIRASVTISMRVLNYNDLTWRHPGSALFAAHHIAKESMAVQDTTNTLADIINAIGVGG